MATKGMMEAVTKKTPEEQLIQMTVEALKMGQRLDNGRHYLMGVKLEDLTVEDCLEAFGFKRNGLGDAE